MILVDANLLLYARITDFAEHAKAYHWLVEALNGTARVGLPWSSLVAFLRISTNPRVFASPLSIDSAWNQVEEWLDCPCVWVPTQTGQHRQVLTQLLSTSRATGNLVPDAELAALAIEHGLTLVTTDGDFSRFANLSWENPIA